MSIEERQQELAAEFADIEDWMDRYGYIIDLGNALPEISESKRLRRTLSKDVRAGYGLTRRLMETAWYTLPPTATL